MYYIYISILQLSRRKPKTEVRLCVRWLAAQAHAKRTFIAACCIERMQYRNTHAVWTVYTCSRKATGIDTISSFFCSRKLSGNTLRSKWRMRMPASDDASMAFELREILIISINYLEIRAVMEILSLDVAVRSMWCGCEQYPSRMSGIC